MVDVHRSARLDSSQRCPKCQGFGYVDLHSGPCSACKGLGLKPRQDKLPILIPAKKSSGSPRKK